MHLFHVPDLDGSAIELPEEEAHHALHVLRLKAGDRVGLLDGRGLEVTAELVEVGKRRVLARAMARVLRPRERAVSNWLAVAPTKQMDRYEWFIEKAVEIGVDRITPILTARTERTKLRSDRLEKVAVAAMKQSQRHWLPLIDAPTALGALLEGPLPEARYFGWCEGAHTPLANSLVGRSDTLVLIGPEGDFTAEEAEAMRRRSCAAVSLGTARLRTETAATVACTLVNFAAR